VIRWCNEQSHKATAEKDKGKLRWLDREQGDKQLDAINRDMMGRITHAKLANRCSNASSVDGARAPTNAQLLARSGNTGMHWSVHQTHAEGHLTTTFCLSDLSFTSAKGLNT
jgi:hypothetical protein